MMFSPFFVGATCKELQVSYPKQTKWNTCLWIRIFPMGNVKNFFLSNTKIGKHISNAIISSYTKIGKNGVEKKLSGWCPKNAG